VTVLEDIPLLDFPLQLLVSIVAALIFTAAGIGSGLRSSRASW
jgi:hypothetical protein